MITVVMRKKNTESMICKTFVGGYEKKAGTFVFFAEGM